MTILEDMPGAAAAHLNLKDQLALIARRFTGAVLDALEASPPDGVTLEDVREFRSTAEIPLARETLAMFEPHTVQVIDRASRSGAVPISFPTLGQLLRAAYDQEVTTLVDGLVEGRGWSALHPKVLVGSPKKKEDRRRLIRAVANQARTNLMQRGVGPLSGEALSESLGTFAYFRFASRRVNLAGKPLQAAWLRARGEAPGPAVPGPQPDRRTTHTPPKAVAGVRIEERTPAARTKANLAAMEVLAGHGPLHRYTAEERRILGGYSGWGGLSLKKAHKQLAAFRDQLPLPEERGLIHEFYTPSRVTEEAVRVLQPFVESLPRAQGGALLALEPSAGIGRFLEAGAHLGARWTAVEHSGLSARTLAARFPEADVHHSSFERWVRNASHGFSLVLSNPPYGARGASVTEDPNRDYREKKAYAYFLRRAGDLLAPGGIGAFLIPAGFLSGKGASLRKLRKKVLLDHHLMGAYRLPSGLFPGAMLVTDLVFLRRRAHPLGDVAAEDESIHAGSYFAEHREMILGEEVGTAGNDDDQTAKPRWGYQVVGEFKGLPELVERPYCGACPVPAPTVIELPTATDDTAEETDSLVERARGLGNRVARYLRHLAEGTDVRNVWPGLHSDLVAFTKQRNRERNIQLKQAASREDGNRGVAALLAVFDKRGMLIEGIAKAPTYTPPFSGSRNDIVALADWIYRLDGKVDVDAIARWHGRLEGKPWPLPSLKDRTHKWVLHHLSTLFDQGWAMDGPGLSLLTPARDYLSGLLWPKVDQLDQALARFKRAANTSSDTVEQLHKQRKSLIAAIAPVQFGDIDLVAPHLRYVPTDLIGDWLTSRRADGMPKVELTRQHGFLLPKGHTYDNYDEAKIGGDAQLFLGFVNNDRGLFKPDKDADESVADARRRYAETIGTEFVAWIHRKPEAQAAYTDAYNRAFRGFVEPTYSTAPLPIDRWDDAITPRPHQSAGARRVIANRRGLLAFGVGVGKTFTGLMVLARARQEGWARRPIVLVPNSLAWKWYKDFKKALPDYRVAVVGSTITHHHAPFLEGKVRASRATTAWIAANKRSRVRIQVARTVPGEWTPIAKLADQGSRVLEHIRSLVKAGAIEHDPGPLLPRAKTDTPRERAEKWRRFQAGEVDAVILTYSAMGRTRLDPDKIRAYANRRPSIRCQVEIDQRNAKTREEQGSRLIKITDAMSAKDRKAAEQKNRRTERQRAVAKEGAAAWIAELLELPPGQEYDPGITWEDIGCDLLVVDEAQNFKNLYVPERRDGGVPKFMGGNQSSTRAWQLDFRAASVRSRANGRGIVLLSATPAKNSPLEFYSLLSLLGEDVWGDVGVDTVEAFIAAFLRIERKMVVNHRMIAEERDCVTGFTNLDVLRDIIYRYAEFKSPDQVGIKLPDVKATPVWVDLNATQDELYRVKAEEIQKLLKATNNKDAQGKILGMMMRLAMITLHPGLDRSWKWKEVQKANIAPSAPKIAAMVARVRQQPSCGHIVFAEPIGSHWWMSQALIAAGIPANRIAILNGTTAKDTALRQSIAERFNGDPEAGKAPEFDVVIANSIAYEGVDLQARTCAIHHMDLPWEPATIEQRNGRGVRQGNTLANIRIYFYLARNSMDGARYSLIQGKHGWMKSLLDAQIKETSNPLATAEMGPEEMLLMLSRDPEETKKTLAAIREREALRVRRQRIRKLLRQTSAMAARFDLARESGDRDPEYAARLRSEAEAMLQKLHETDPSEWPWVKVIEAARDRSVVVPPWKTHDGVVERTPVLPAGFCATLRDPDGDDEGHEVRIGVADPDNRKRHGMLLSGSLVWHSVHAGDDRADLPRWDKAQGSMVKLTHLSPHRMRAVCPLVGEPSDTSLREFKSTIGRSWARAGWYLADDAWREAVWPTVVKVVREHLGRQSRYSYGRGASSPAIAVPVVEGGKLKVVGSSLRLRQSTGELVPPTEAGWLRFLALRGEIERAELRGVAREWWGRSVPRV